MFECNDGFVSDIQRTAAKNSHQNPPPRFGAYKHHADTTGPFGLLPGPINH